MRILLRVLVFVGLIIGAPVRADEASDAIQSVISNQIEAFRADDFETAFSFASPTIRSMFGDWQTFGTMVRNGYPMVWRPADVRFSGLSAQGDGMVPNVLVTDQAGALHVLQYEMTLGPSGWLINGVSSKRSGEAGA